MAIEVKDFNKEVIEQSFNTPVLVDFWAEWCGPCKMLTPVLERIAEQNKGRFVFAKLNTDTYPDISAQYGIRGIPNVKLFIDGQPVDEFQGALPERNIIEWLDKVLPSKEKEQLQYAKQLLNLNPEEAKKVLSELLTSNSSLFEARVLMAKLLLFENPAKALDLVNNYENQREFTEEAASIFTIASLFEKKNNTASLPEDAVKSLYVSALEDLSACNFESALDKFIDVIRENRMYDDDGSRKACIAIFKYLGEDNPITIKKRRPFGSALYV